MSEHPGKSQTDLVIEWFVDRMEEIYPDLDREEFHGAISEYVQQAVTEADSDEEDSDDES